jgi:hypothetical protein
MKRIERRPLMRVVKSGRVPHRTAIKPGTAAYFVNKKPSAWHWGAVHLPERRSFNP